MTCTALVVYDEAFAIDQLERMMRRPMPKHIICDSCFKKASPIEELCIGTLHITLVPCAYCGESHPANTNHTLSGEGPYPHVQRRLLGARMSQGIRDWKDAQAEGRFSRPVAQIPDDAELVVLSQTIEYPPDGPIQVEDLPVTFETPFPIARK